MASPAYFSTEPPKGLDLLVDLVEEGRQHGAQLLGVVAGRKLGRPDEIGEQRGDGFALVGGDSLPRLAERRFRSVADSSSS